MASRIWATTPNPTPAPTAPVTASVMVDTMNPKAIMLDIDHTTYPVAWTSRQMASPVPDTPARRSTNGTLNPRRSPPALRAVSVMSIVATIEKTATTASLPASSRPRGTGRTSR